MAQVLSAHGLIDDVPGPAAEGGPISALSTPHLTFSQWLELSWFYPAGFEKERIIETAQAWVVLGNEVVYKFLKAGSDSPTPREAFRKRWRASCEELLDNRPFAPDLYLGLRLLRWIDDEPQWMSESPGFDLNPLSPPSRADDVAIVLRRIPDSDRLSHQLDRREGIPRRQIVEIGRSLAAFHRHSREQRQTAFERDPDGVLTAIHSRYLGSLSAFVSEFGSFLDPFSQIALHEVRAYLSAFYAHFGDRFVNRGRAGFILDGHGALRAERVVYFGSRHPQFATRLARHPLERSDDCLADLALLAVDLEARGHAHIARELEQAYLQASPPPTHDQELYRFYKVASAMRCAEQLLRGAFEARAISATSFLATAFRHATGLDSAFLIALGGAHPSTQQALARSIGEFVPLVTVAPDPNSSTPDDLALERLLEHAARKIRSGASAAIVWPFNRDEERALFARAARNLGVPHLIVQCVGDTPEAAPRRHTPTPRPWTPPFTAPDLPLLHLRLDGPLPELAFQIVDHIRSGIPRIGKFPRLVQSN